MDGDNGDNKAAGMGTNPHLLTPAAITISVPPSSSSIVFVPVVAASDPPLCDVPPIDVAAKTPVLRLLDNNGIQRGPDLT